MGPDDFRKMIKGHQVATPFVIATRDGHSYTIAHPSDINIPTSNPDLVTLSVRKRGIVLVRLDAIEAMHHEPEPSQKHDDKGPDDFCTMIKGQQVATPFVIVTKGGRSYTISDAANAYIAPAYPTTVALFIPGKGVIMLDLDSIESIQCEPEAVVGRQSPEA